jgi:hypothetical protein
MQMPALDRDKLAKMLGMLGSRHDGEVAAAGRSAHILLKDARTTWTEVLTQPDGAEPSDRYKLGERKQRTGAWLSSSREGSLRSIT